MSEETDSGDNQSDYMERYGAKPLLPFAKARYNIAYNFAKIIGKIPVFRTFISLFIKIPFFSLTLFAKTLALITLNSGISKRFSAEVRFAKDNYRAGVSGKQQPPTPE